MASCRTLAPALLLLLLAQSLPPLIASDDLALQDVTPAGGTRQHGRPPLISEGALQEAATTAYGMTATPVAAVATTTAGLFAASTLTSAATISRARSRAAGAADWLHSTGGSRGTKIGYSITANSSRSRSNKSSRSSSSSSSWNRGRHTNERGGVGVGEGRRALSLLAPAVASRARTSSLFVVSSHGTLGDPPPAANTAHEPVAYPTAAAAAKASLLASDRTRCRPLVRSPPLRFDISKPTNTELFLAPAADGHAEVPGSTSLADAGSGSSEMACGGGGGGVRGMTASFTWLESVNSTMDEVKTLIVNQEGSSAKRVFAIAAREQVRGRGTKGRAWIGLPGNVFLTVAIPLDRIPVPLSLIPLRVGTLIAPEIQRRLLLRGEETALPLPSSPSPGEAVAAEADTTAAAGLKQPPRVSLKWPNDVLIEGSKVAGVLIEAELPFLLVGIGVNVRHKPEVPREGSDRGRPAACLADFGVDSSDEAVRALSAALTEKLCSWASGTDSASAALSDWSGWVDWSLPLEIRDEGRAVTAVGIAQDGRLRVVDSASGNEELLSTEYLL